MTELAKTEKYRAARECVVAHKSDLCVSEEAVEEIASDWAQFEEDFDPEGETHPWKLKYLIALAFCKGWEARDKRRG